MKNRVSFKEAVILYYIMFSSFLIMSFISSYLNASSLYITLFIEIFLICGMFVFYTYYKKLPMTETFALRKPGFVNILLSALLGVSATFFINNIYNLFLVLIEELFGRIYLMPSVPFSGNIYADLFLVAVVPAICEELAFRGFLLGGMSEQGKKFAFFMVAAFFTGMHLMFQSSLPMYILSLIITYAVFKTGSVYCGMIVHFINNALSVFISAGDTQGEETIVYSIKNVLIDAYGSIEAGMTDIITTSVITGIVLFVILICFARFAKNKKKIEYVSDAENTIEKIEIKTEKMSLGKKILFVLPFFALILFYYYAEISIIINGQ